MNMQIMVVTQDELKKLRETQERHELEELRASLRIYSLADSQERFEQIGRACATALQLVEEAYLVLAEDDLDTWETAKEKSDKLERIEREHARCIAVWENQLRRLNWEARQSRDGGIGSNLKNDTAGMA
jgi:hypothetical protein